MSKTISIDDAFPVPGTGYNQPTEGLSKREYFAIHIMSGFAVNNGALSGAKSDRNADKAVEWADALIRALNKE